MCFIGLNIDACGITAYKIYSTTRVPTAVPYANTGFTARINSREKRAPITNKDNTLLAKWIIRYSSTVTFSVQARKPSTDCIGRDKSPRPNLMAPAARLPPKNNRLTKRHHTKTAPSFAYVSTPPPFFVHLKI